MYGAAASSVSSLRGHTVSKCVDNFLQDCISAQRRLRSACVSLRSISVFHYENTPIQIYRKFDIQKTENFQIKDSDIFSYFCSKHRLWVLVRTASRGGSKEYPQSMFLSTNKKYNVYPFKHQFYYIKVGFKGVKIIVFVMFWVDKNPKYFRRTAKTVVRFERNALFRLNIELLRGRKIITVCKTEFFYKQAMFVFFKTPTLSVMERSWFP